MVVIIVVGYLALRVSGIVAYEINAYTDRPNQLVTIYSNLMENILDRFDRAGVEILSPQHVALRDSPQQSNAHDVKREQTGNLTSTAESRRVILHEILEWRENMYCEDACPLQRL